MAPIYKECLTGYTITLAVAGSARAEVKSALVPVLNNENERHCRLEQEGMQGERTSPLTITRGRENTYWIQGQQLIWTVEAVGK